MKFSQILLSQNVFIRYNIHDWSQRNKVKALKRWPIQVCGWRNISTKHRKKEVALIQLHSNKWLKMLILKFAVVCAVNKMMQQSESNPLLMYHWLPSNFKISTSIKKIGWIITLCYSTQYFWRLVCKRLWRTRTNIKGIGLMCRWEL